MNTPNPLGTEGLQPPAVPGGASQLRIGWIMPPFFHELPVDAPDADIAAEQLRTLAMSVLPDRPMEDQYAFALLLGAQLEPMTEGNVIYAGMSFVEVEGQPTSSTVLVSQFAHDKGEEEIVPSLVDTLSLSYPRDDVQQTDLPCGPAVSRVASSPFAYEDPAGTVQTVQRNIIQTHIPLPNCGEILLFELGVYSAEGWELHSELFAEILKTLEWCTDQEIVEAAMLAQRPPPSTEDVISDSVRRELNALCGELVRASTEADLADQGEVRLSAITCAECWEKGLRSSCRVVHEWRLSGLPEQVLLRVGHRAASHLAGLGWQVHDGDTSNGTVQADNTTHAVTTGVEYSAGLLRAEVSTFCTRSTNTTVSDDFG